MDFLLLFDELVVGAVHHITYPEGAKRLVYSPTLYNLGAKWDG